MRKSETCTVYRRRFDKCVFIATTDRPMSMKDYKRPILTTNCQEHEQRGTYICARNSNVLLLLLLLLLLLPLLLQCYYYYYYY